MRPIIEADQLGAFASITVDPAVYETETIFRTAYWFTDRYFVFLSRTSDNQTRVELRAKEGTGADLERACADFCNSLIDFRVRQIVATETAGVREALVTKAFSETASPGRS